MLKWNNDVKLIFADVDSTIIDVYTEATPGMVSGLEKVLAKGIVIFMISGGGKKSILNRVISKIKVNKQNIILAHCMGAEIIGFNENGDEVKPYFYSSYNQLMNEVQKQKWREIMNNLIKEFHLETYDPVNTNVFAQRSNHNPNKIIYDDRGPQITLELVNSVAQREAIVTRGRAEIEKENLPIEVSLGGTFAIDFHLKGVDKTATVKRFISNPEILSKYKLEQYSKDPQKYYEIWGDKFYPDGSDFKVCKALSQDVRTIDFRSEDQNQFEKGYNIVLWDGEKRLEKGLEEYLGTL